MNRALSVHPRVLSTELGDGTGVLLHMDTKMYYTLNMTALAVWRGLANGDVPARIADAVVERFAVDGGTASSDVDELVGQFVVEGLVTSA